MRVLIACERSGVVREAFRARGHVAYSCDLAPAEDGSAFHITGDVIAELGLTPRPFMSATVRAAIGRATQRSAIADPPAVLPSTMFSARHKRAIRTSLHSWLASNAPRLIARFEPRRNPHGSIR
jgi:hypothetical protein